MFKKTLKKLDFVKEEIHKIPGSDKKPRRGTALKYFFVSTRESIGLIFKEKEIIFFALLQWVAIALGYYLWIQMLNWIPEEVWRSTENSDSGSIADVVLLLWSFVVVGLVALPIGILTACIGAVHLLHRQGKSSTIATCLSIVIPRAGRLWFFQWIDSWITVKQILKRLPKKRDWPPSALSEALYYAWKLGTLGIPFALLTGRGLIESGKQSVMLVKDKLADTMLLRTGYSVISWIIGIVAYVGTIFFFIYFDNLVPQGEAYSVVFDIYFWAGVPLLVAVGIIQLFVRPIFILSSAKLFADYIDTKEEKLMFPTTSKKLTKIFIIFGVLLLVILAVFLFKDELGITEMLSTPYQ
jgi:hypothetical protein